VSACPSSSCASTSLRAVCCSLLTPSTSSPGPLGCRRFVAPLSNNLWHNTL
jgi:hypothetical protein